MAEQDTITREGFSRLLYWLDPDVDRAGCKYEIIRTRLIRMFSCRGCHEPELLTDQTMDRVTRKMADLDLETEGNPTSYFYKVAVFIHKEWLNKQNERVHGIPITEMIGNLALSEGISKIEAEHICLESCLAELSVDDHYMIVEYYREQKSAKILHRRSIAQKLNISSGALHTRANRVRERLSKCIQNCSEKIY